MQHQMQEFNSPMVCVLAIQSFAILSKTLQSKKMSAVSGLRITELTIDTYKDMRTDENAMIFFNTNVKKAVYISFIAELSLPRKRSA